MSDKILSLQAAIEEAPDRLFYITDHCAIDVLRVLFSDKNYPDIKAISYEQKKEVDKLQVQFGILFIFDIFDLLADKSCQNLIEALLERKVKIVFLYKEKKRLTGDSSDFWEFFLSQNPPELLNHYEALEAIKLADVTSLVNKHSASIQEPNQKVDSDLRPGTIEFKPILPVHPLTSQNLLKGAYLLCQNRFLSFSWFEQPLRQSLDEGLTKFSLEKGCTPTISDVLHKLENEVYIVPSLWLAWEQVHNARALDSIIEVSDEGKTAGSELWGVLKFEDDKELFLGGKLSGYIAHIPNTDRVLQFNVDPRDQRILRIEPGEGVSVRYFDQEGKETANQYIDIHTGMLLFRLEGYIPNIRKAQFNGINFIQHKKIKTVVRNNEFIGQNDLIANILSKVRRKSSDYSCIICGISHSGKTSLINKLQHLITSENDQQYFHMNILTFKEWWRTRTEGDKDTWDSFRELFQAFMVVHPAHQHKKKVFVIDDYDFFYHQYGDQFGRLLCFYHDKYHDDNVHFILAGQRSIQFFKFNGHSYSFPAGLEHLTLRGFKTQGKEFIDDLLYGSGLASDCISATDKALMLKLSSGYPFYIMAILGDYLSDLKLRSSSFKLADLSPGFIDKYRKLACGNEERFITADNSLVSLALILDKLSMNGGMISKERLINQIATAGDEGLIKSLQLRVLAGIDVLEGMGFLVVRNELISGEPLFLFNKHKAFFDKKSG